MRRDTYEIRNVAVTSVLESRSLRLDSSHEGLLFVLPIKTILTDRRGGQKAHPSAHRSTFVLKVPALQNPIDAVKLAGRLSGRLSGGKGPTSDTPTRGLLLRRIFIERIDPALGAPHLDIGKCAYTTDGLMLLLIVRARLIALL